MGSELLTIQEFRSGEINLKHCAAETLLCALVIDVGSNHCVNQFVTTVIWWMFTMKLVTDIPITDRTRVALGQITEVLMYTEYTRVLQSIHQFYSKEILMKIWIVCLFFNNCFVKSIDKLKLFSNLFEIMNYLKYLGKERPNHNYLQ